MESETTSIRRLRVRRGGCDSARAVLLAERLLGSASFGPGDLSPSGVLCVRNVRDPKPGALRLDPAAVRPPPGWEQALRETLDAVLREAARPAYEAVPASSEAVLFADRAELLSSLATDWLSAAPPRWWWEGLLGEPPTRPAVVRAWAEGRHYVPAALELLARRGLATRFVAGLDVAEIAGIADGVASAFGLPWLSRAVGVLAETGPPGAPGRPDSPTAWQAPWSDAAPEAVAARLDPLRELFAGALLALRRAPSGVREPPFGRAVDAWTEARAPGAAGPNGAAAGAPAQYGAARGMGRVAPEGAAARSGKRGATAGAGAESTNALGRPIDFRRGREPGPASAPNAGASGAEPGLGAAPTAGASGAEPGLGAAPTAGASGADPALGPDPTAGGPVAERSVRPSQRAGARAAESGPGGAGSGPAKPGSGSEAGRALPDEPHVLAAPADRATAAGGAEPDTTVETQLGGLFFVVVIALRLGLTPDFTTPSRRGLGLDPWKLIAELGRRMLDEANDADAPDQAEPIDHADAADAAWALLGRLAGGEPATRRAELLAPWLDVLARYAAVRLSRSLGLAGGGEVADLLLRRRARVTVSPVHVDVVFALDEHPIEIRLAGLDRDPGWLPAAGRHLRFVFE